jgi:DNA-binding LacI/PurR family transcriptional regulator
MAFSSRKSSGGRRFVSSRDVAERAGVSRSAVSRAFTPGASIAPATLARVQAAADALGYQVNDLARALLSEHSRLVGLVTSDPETPFRGDMIRALSRALIERGNVPTIISVGPSADDVAKASRQLLRYRAEATIFLSGSPPASLIEMTRRNRQPLLLINRAETGIDAVRCDNRGGARQAFRLFRQSGAFRPAMANTVNPSPSFAARESAFVKIARAEGLSVLVGRGERSDYEGGRMAARQLLASGLKIDAVFCGSDLLAFGAIDEFRSAGLSVPDDISVIGFDDVAISAWGAYNLTTLRQDPARIAKEVIAILDRRSADPDLPPISVTFPVDLVVRGTVRRAT